MYSITDYGVMIADRPRITAYAEAMRRVITPDSVVVDLGAGPGLFAMLACRFGARRVYAIEPDDAIQVAREIAAENGLTGRIEFIQAMSTDITLPERADVIVSDIGGVMPWFGTHLPSIADARQRLLAPGGRLIPARDTAWAAVVHAPDLYARQTAPWDDNGFGFNMQSARRLAVNTFRKGAVAEEQLLTPLQRWATVDYARVDDWNVQAEVGWQAGRAGLGHGLLVGLDRTLVDGLTFSNAPDRSGTLPPDTIYSTLFFPWTTAVALETGDLVDVEIRAVLIGSDYVWCWQSSVRDGRQPSVIKARFEQSTVMQDALSPASLRKTSASYVPALTENGRMARFVLEAMAQGVPLGTIAAGLARAFPGHKLRDPLSYVAALARQYG
jgi:protein arginine N-methyltransferase 1